MSQLRKPVEAENPDSIQSIKKAVADHYTENPTHGVGCACLDRLIGPVRKGIDPIAFNYEAQNKESELERKIRWAVHYVFITAEKS